MGMLRHVAEQMTKGELRIGLAPGLANTVAVGRLYCHDLRHLAVVGERPMPAATIPQKGMGIVQRVEGGEHRLAYVGDHQVRSQPLDQPLEVSTAAARQWFLDEMKASLAGQTIPQPSWLSAVNPPRKRNASRGVSLPVRGRLEERPNSSHMTDLRRAPA
jgi:hypothetical protein